MSDLIRHPDGNTLDSGLGAGMTFYSYKQIGLIRVIGGFVI